VSLSSAAHAMNRNLVDRRFEQIGVIPVDYVQAWSGIYPALRTTNWGMLFTQDRLILLYADGTLGLWLAYTGSVPIRELWRGPRSNIHIAEGSHAYRRVYIGQRRAWVRANDAGFGGFCGS
jgi:hypothetical protein